MITRPAQVLCEPKFEVHLGFRIEEWDHAADRPKHLMALAENISVAHAAFEAARKDRPERYVLLRQGTRVVTDSFRDEEAQMCGRFSQHYTWQQIHAFSQPLTLSGPPLNLEPRYNISPTQQVGALVPQSDGSLAYERKRWWLVPGWWSKTLREVPATFNARAEGIEAKPMFRDAWKRRRCIIPASGFFEWSGPKAARLPWYISAADGGLLGMAGLHDTWTDRETGDEVQSCTIITCAANAFMSEIHDRMPVFLAPATWESYLAQPDLDTLKPAPEGLLQRWRVTSEMNSNRFEAPAAIQPL
ncbi:SOS response-associated peptidase [Ancylobacter sp. A5.8]|uniref:SOS response-associated peptidase n=1 Tax=Ancylobacter gelatini TaxID=2919920 RepID=UPI001F4EE72C|nr:SOS response-associated peptidase [Ancylobacter gelatini]MCJ8142985.1 SOS response-associated peptidase [Ancylobacter gelatini]